MPNVGGLALKGLQGVNQAGRWIGRNPGKSIAGGVSGYAAHDLFQHVKAGFPLPEEIWEQFEANGHLNEFGEFEQDFLTKLKTDDPERFAAVMYSQGMPVGGGGLSDGMS